MCDGIVLRTASGEEFCLWIPVQIPKLKWPPDPDPMRDLHILANIHQLVSDLGNESLRGRMSETLYDSAQQMVRALPEGFELGSDFMAMPGRAAAG